MDIQKGIDMINRRREINRQYYIRKKGIPDDNDDDKEKKLFERIEKQLLAYEKQKERQKRDRLERGLKPKGRPCKTREGEDRTLDPMTVLKELDALD